MTMTSAILSKYLEFKYKSRDKSVSKSGHSYLTSIFTKKSWDIAEQRVQMWQRSKPQITFSIFQQNQNPHSGTENPYSILLSSSYVLFISNKDGLSNRWIRLTTTIVQVKSLHYVQYSLALHSSVLFISPT